MRKPQDTATIIFKVPPDLWDDLRRVAEQSDRSMSAVCRVAVRELIRQQKEGRPSS